jgi:hypothetical protein
MSYGKWRGPVKQLDIFASSDIDWFDNDQLFFAQATIGHQFAERVAERLRRSGCEATANPLQFRDKVSERWRFRTEQDVLVAAPRKAVVEVKSRDLSFTGPEDYPYATAIVDTVGGWEVKEPPPNAVVLVSQRTGGMAVVRTSTSSTWTTVRRRDHIRQIDDLFYEVERKSLTTFDEFVAWLRGNP